MKNLFRIFAVAGFALAMTSCGTTYDTYGSRYPQRYPSSTTVIIYRTRDGGTYRTGEIYRDRYGNIYQNGRIIRRGDYGNVGVIYYPQSQYQRNLPPGQAKKIYGGSAKDYAPGQMKKKYKHYGKQEDDGYGYGNERHKGHDNDND